MDTQAVVESLAKFVSENVSREAAELYLREAKAKSIAALSICLDKGITLEEFVAGLEKGLERKAA